MRTYWRLFSVVLLFVAPWPPRSLAQERATPNPVQFAAPIVIQYPASYPQAIASGDFTSDGFPDLIVGDEFGGLYTKLGRGDGRFKSWRYVFPPGHDVSALALGKFDGKNLDAVVNNISDAWVLMGGGGGGFPHDGWLDAGGNFVTGFAVGDFDHDGKQDIAALVDIPGQNSDSSEVYLYLGNGDGTFQSPRQLPVSPLGPVAILAGDFEGNGNLDLAVLSTYLHDHVGRVSVLLGDGKGNFGRPIVFPLNGLIPKYPVAMTLADFDGDETLDIALAYANSDATGSSFVQILLGNGDGTFRRGARARAGLDPQAITTADFNGDGIPDLAVPDTTHQLTSSYLSILVGKGDGTFQPPAKFRVHGVGASGVTVADFNGDGKPDVATVNVNSQNVSVLLNTTPFPAPKGRRARAQGH
ncbi:MAG TPA: VCBS repeat-containing protein [Terriglobales bacterium]|nr:VCBS repeat-containing protein [Terriglobales bacterium]